MQQDSESIIPGATQRELVLDGVRYADLHHADSWWRLGATNPSWRQELLALPQKPDAAALESMEDRGLWIAPASSPSPLAVMCCGLGSVWPGMGRELYDNFPVARAAMDRLAAVADWDVLGLMDETDVEKISLTRWQSPYVFMLEYAQWSVFSSLGLSPSLFCGHSLGEMIALCFSGIYSPEVAWYILDTRAVHMAELEARATRETGMMAVHASAEVIEEACAAWPALYVSNYNTPHQFILSGPREVLQEARKSLRKRRIPAIVLNVSLAFHHPSMRVLRDLSLRRLNALEMHAPERPMLSCITTEFYPEDQASICEHIADLDENSVRWTECVRAMWNRDGIRNFLELGPQDTLCSLVVDNEPEARSFSAGRKGREVEGMRQACARLYSLGYLQRDAVEARVQAASDGSDAAGMKDAPARHCGLMPVAEVREAASCVPVTNEPFANAHEAQKTAGDNDAVTEVPAATETALAVVLEVLSRASGRPLADLRPEMDLRYDLALRSSRFPLIVQEVEQALHIAVNFEDLLRISTIGDLARVLSGDSAAGGKSAGGSGAASATSGSAAWTCAAPLRRYAALEPSLAADSQNPLRLRPLPFDPCGDGLSLRKGDVLVVYASDPLMISRLMGGLAPVGCVFAVPETMIEACAPLARAGARLVSLELPDLPGSPDASMRSAVEALAKALGKVDGVIFIPPVVDADKGESAYAKKQGTTSADASAFLRGLLQAALPHGLRFACCCSVLPSSREGCFFDNPLDAELELLVRENGLSARAIHLLRAGERNSLDEWGDMLARELQCGTRERVIWVRAGELEGGVFAPEVSPGDTVGECPKRFPLVFPDPSPAYRATATLHQAACHFSRFADPALGEHGGLEEIFCGQRTPRLPLCRSLEALLEGARQWLPWLKVSGFCDLRFHEPPLLPSGVTRECRLTVEAEPWLMQDTVMTRMCRGVLSVRGLTPNGRHTGHYDPVAEGMVWLAADCGRVLPLWPHLPTQDLYPGDSAVTEQYYRSVGLGQHWKLLTGFTALADDMFMAGMRAAEPSIAPGGICGYTDDLLVVEGVAQAAWIAITQGDIERFPVPDEQHVSESADVCQWRLNTVGFIRMGYEREAGPLRLVLRRSWADDRLLRFDAQAVDVRGRVFLTIHHLEFERPNPAG